MVARPGYAAEFDDGDEGCQLAQGDVALHIRIPDITNKNIELRLSYIRLQAWLTTNEVSSC
ncbi:hypothetical protein D3C85_1778890 [compost metagenome]